MAGSPEFQPPRREPADGIIPPPPTPREPTPSRAVDLTLVREVMAGSVDAWHRFVDRYCGLLEAVVGRYLKDPEEARTVVVELLEHLYHGKLAEYGGRAALSTWLVPVARSASVDHLRRRLGRPQTLRFSATLEEPDRTVFRMVHLQGLSVDAVLHRLAVEGRPLDRLELFEVVDRLEACLSPRVLRGLEYRAQAGKGFSMAARLLEFFDGERMEAEERMERESPERRLLEREALERTARIEALVDRLPPREQRALHLRYVRRWSAKRIAGEIGVTSPREIYTLLDRALRSLRRWARETKPQGAK
jgi:RNA polymerase sigma factor (sigma-70 family)